MALFGYENNQIVLAIETRDRDGNVLDITGATLEAQATNEGTTVAGTCAITSATDGIFTVTFASGALSVDEWNVQARVTLSGVARTVYDTTLVIYESLA